MKEREKETVWLLESQNQVPGEVLCIHPAITYCLFRFRGGTEIGKGGLRLAAKISPGGPVLAGEPKFSLQARDS